MLFDALTALPALPPAMELLTARTNALIRRELGLQQTETQLDKALRELTAALRTLDLRCPLAAGPLRPDPPASEER